MQYEVTLFLQDGIPVVAVSGFEETGPLTIPLDHTVDAWLEAIRQGLSDLVNAHGHDPDTVLKLDACRWQGLDLPTIPFLVTDDYYDQVKQA